MTDLGYKLIVDYEMSRDGYTILKVNYDNKIKYIGSKYNVKNDIKQIVDQFNEVEAFNTVYIIGLGTGAYIDSIKKTISSTIKVIVLEPIVEIYEKYNNLNQVLNEDTQFNIFSLEQEHIDKVKESIIQNTFNGIRIIIHPGYEQVFTKEVKDTIELIRDYLRNTIMARSTSIYFSKMWYESTIKNLKYICNSKSVTDIEGCYEGKPAVIVSAGPSLDKNIKELKKVKNKFVIISGGRTLKALLENDIVPDYLCIVDGSEESYMLVEDYIDKYNIPLVSSELVPYKVLEKIRGEKLFYANSQEINKLLKTKTKNLSVGGSVAHLCTMFAIHCKCNPIIFVGQDLAYTNEKVHADNSTFKNINYDELENFEKVKSDMDIYVRDIYGNFVRTSPSLDTFRKTFEEIIRVFNTFKFINCTEGGAHINGSSIMKLVDCIRIYDDGKKLDIIKIGEHKNILEIETVERLLKNTITYLEVLLDKTKEAVNINKKILNNSRKKNNYIEKYIKQLEKMDNFILKEKEDVLFIEYLLASTIHEVMNDRKYGFTGKETYIERVKKMCMRSEVLYSGINEQIKYALPILKDELEVVTNWKGKV